jgi:hypothetical protein
MNFFHHIGQDFNNISRQFHIPPPAKPPVVSIQPIAQPFQPPPITPQHILPFLPIPEPIKSLIDPVINQITQQVKPPEQHQTTDPAQVKSTLVAMPPAQSTFSQIDNTDYTYILYGLVGLGIIVFVFNKN